MNLSWVVTLAALSVTGVACVAGSPRAWVLFYDGDSIFPVLIVHDLFAGVPLHYVFSYVLFFPELAVYVAVAALHLNTQLTMAIVGVIWLFLIGVGVRAATQWAMPVVKAATTATDMPGGASAAATRSATAAGPHRCSHLQPPPPSMARLLAGTVGSLVAVAVLLAQIVVERSADRDAIEFASLAMTSTYYVSTTFAMILTIGLVSRAVHSAPVSHVETAPRGSVLIRLTPPPARETRDSRIPRMLGTVIALAAIATAATWVNPMYVAWSAAPAVLALITLVFLRRAAIAGIWRAATALVSGSVLGMLARVPFASWMGSGLRPPMVPSPTPSGLHATDQTSAAATSLAQLGWWAKELQFWGASFATFWNSTWTRLDSIGGLIDFALTILAVLSAVAVTVIAYRTHRRGMLALGLVVLWTVPITAAWPLVMATTATRYWEAIEFAPLVTVAVLVAWLLERRLEGASSWRWWRLISPDSSPEEAREAAAEPWPVPSDLEGWGGLEHSRFEPGGSGRNCSVQGRLTFCISRRLVLFCVAVMAASVLLAGGVSLRAARSTADVHVAASVMCVANWVDAHPDEYGAGTYWSIRSAKAYVADPSHLLQITVNFQSWRWLVNQRDFNHLTVSYLVRSSGDGLQMGELPRVLRSAPTVARCGSFTIQQLSQPLVITPYWGLQQD